MDSAGGAGDPIEVVISTNDHRVTVRIRGDVDAASADHLRAVLDITEDARHLVVDLSGSAFVDIAGMRAIARCARRRRTIGRELVVAAPPPSAETILRMTPWHRYVRWEPREPTDDG